MMTTDNTMHLLLRPFRGSYQGNGRGFDVSAGVLHYLTRIRPTHVA